MKDEVHNDSDSLSNIGRSARMRDLINHSNETDEDNLDWVEATQQDDTMHKLPIATKMSLSGISERSVEDSKDSRPSMTDVSINPGHVLWDVTNRSSAKKRMTNKIYEARYTSNSSKHHWNASISAAEIKSLDLDSWEENQIKDLPNETHNSHGSHFPVEEAWGLSLSSIWIEEEFTSNQLKE